MVDVDDLVGVAEVVEVVERLGLPGGEGHEVLAAALPGLPAARRQARRPQRVGMV